MRRDGRPDMTKPIVIFHNFANAPKSSLCTLIPAEYRLQETHTNEEPAQASYPVGAGSSFLGQQGVNLIGRSQWKVQWIRGSSLLV